MYGKCGFLVVLEVNRVALYTIVCVEKSVRHNVCIAFSLVDCSRFMLGDCVQHVSSTLGQAKATQREI